MMTDAGGPALMTMAPATIPTPPLDTPESLEVCWRQASRLAKSTLVPRALRDRPTDVLLVLLHGRQLGLPTTQALAQLYAIEGSVVPSAQLQAALVMRAGHELRIEHSDVDSCTVAIRRAGTDYWQRASWTIAEARAAGLLDRWVQRWVATGGRNHKEIWTLDETATAPPAPAWVTALVAEGQVHQRDNWYRYRGDMLRCRALSRAARSICPDALMALGGVQAFTAEERGVDDDLDVGAAVAHDDHGLDPAPDHPPTATEALAASRAPAPEAADLMAAATDAQDRAREVAQEAEAEAEAAVPADDLAACRSLADDDRGHLNDHRLSWGLPPLTAVMSPAQLERWAELYRPVIADAARAARQRLVTACREAGMTSESRQVWLRELLGADEDGNYVLLADASLPQLRVLEAAVVQELLNDEVDEDQI